MEKMGEASLLVLVIGILFAVAGIGMWTNTIRGLVTGGPRDRTKPGQPHVYDRIYYLMTLLMITGWSIGILSFLANVDSNRLQSESGFMIGWGICAVGMGLMFSLRGDMMLSGARYQAKHGFILSRPFYTQHIIQRERQPLIWKIMPLIFLVIGAGVLVFNLPHFGEVPGQVEAGASALIRHIQGLLKPA